MDSSIYLSLAKIRSLGSALSVAEGGQNDKLCSSISKDKPVAFLFRQIATPSFELLWFVKRAKRLGYEPVVIEHTSDRFSVHNSYKRSLISLPIVTGRGRNRQLIWRRLKIANQDDAEGRILKSIILDSGESLVSFHHRMLVSILGDRCPHLIDLSTITKSAHLGAEAYYGELFELLLGNCVLFEDFVVDKQTLDFFLRVVSPAFVDVVKRKGFSPKIGRLIYGSRAALAVWNSYPSLAVSNLSLGTRVT